MSANDTMTGAGATQNTGNQSVRNDNIDVQGGSNFGWIGGAIDSLGLSVKSWVDRADRNKQFAQQQENFDAQFKENVRRYGMDFALREWSTRAGVSMQQAQQLYNQTAQTALQGQQMAMGSLGIKSARMDLDDKMNRDKVTKSFLKGWKKGM